MEFTKNPLIDWLHRAYRYSLTHQKEVLIGVLVIFGMIFLGVGYGFYKSGVQKRAQKSFTEALKYFDARVISESKEDLDFNKEVFKTEIEKWTKVEEVFKAGYQQNKNSGIAPMFLAYQAEALMHLGKLNEAVPLMKNAVKSMSDSALKAAYTVKQSLMQLDSDNKEWVDEGLSILKEIALDQKSVVHDMVLYRLGEYFWYAKNTDEVKNYWNQLILLYGKASKEPSLWAELARPKLKLITSK